MASTTAAPAIPARGQDGASGSGSLTELAALEAARDEKRRLLTRAAAAAVTGLGKKARFPAGCTADDLPALLQRYYWSEPAAEVLGHDPAELAGLALGHLKLAEVRPPGSATVDVHRLADGRAVVRLVTDDMPYLVDSVTAEVVRQGIDLAHIVHPVVVVRRDLTGAMIAFCDSSSVEGCGSDALTESWMAVVLDGPVDDEASGDLVAGLRTVLDDVRSVDEDSERLRARVLELAGRLDVLAEGRSAPAAGPVRASSSSRPASSSTRTCSRSASSSTARTSSSTVRSPLTRSADASSSSGPSRTTAIQDSVSASEPQPTARLLSQNALIRPRRSRRTTTTGCTMWASPKPCRITSAVTESTR